MVGAGLFGFMINPPIALYFMQGLNTTPLHGHAALFGVYGMLGIGLDAGLPARHGAAALCGRRAGCKFWLLGDEHRAVRDVRGQPAAGGPDADVGLRGPGLLVRAQHGVSGRPRCRTLRWMRVPGDTLFALGALVLVAFRADHTGAEDALVEDELSACHARRLCRHSAPNVGLKADVAGRGPLHTPRSGLI